MNAPYWTGRTLAEFVRDREAHEKSTVAPARQRTGTERRLERFWQTRDTWRSNAKKLIDAGCRISTASDTLTLPPRALMRGNEGHNETFFYYPGEGTLLSIEGLVEIGM